MASRVRPAGRVYAFEGSAPTFDLLRRNIRANDSQGVIEANFAVVTDRPARYAPVTRRANTGATFFRTSEEAKVCPPCVVLDLWYPEREDKLDFIKIDVEGMELQVLRGGQKLVRRFLPVLYVEINAAGLDRQDLSVSQLESELSTLGYHFFRNAHLRNSSTDSFSVARLQHLGDGGEFFDLLAVHPESDRYPHGAPGFDPDRYRATVRGAHSLPARVLRRVRRMVAVHGIW
jgi:FkbM family methyltransferase